MFSFALVSRSLDVSTGGGIGAYVTVLALLLSRQHRVTVITTDLNEPALDTIFPRDHETLRAIAVPEPQPDELGSWNNLLHLWSARVYDGLRAEFASEPPDYVEFPDYLGEGAVTLQARRTRDPFLADTTIGVRAHTTVELCSILNGSVASKDFRTTSVFDLERYALANADHFLFAGDEILSAYRRFYGERRIAPSVRVRHPVGFTADPETSAPALDAAEPLRMLYLGRLERRKGVHNLVDAVAGLPTEGWSLTLVGGDTETAPLATSMHRYLTLAAVGDPRIQVTGPVAHEEVHALIERHDLVVLPSLWECWPTTALEALSVNRPLLATPVGGLTEIVDGGACGMLSRGVAASDLAEAVETAVAQRGELARMAADRAPLQRFGELTDEQSIVDVYERLASLPQSRTAKRTQPSTPPLVSVIVPYFRLADHVEECIESVFAQRYRPLEVIVVNDGSFDPRDTVLERIAESRPVKIIVKPNGGLGSARNAGVAQSRGKYVFPLDADNMVEDGFIERAVGVLELDPEIGYVTAWTRYVDDRGVPLEDGPDGYQPLGNGTPGVDQNNIAGDAAAVLRRALFDRYSYDEELTSFEDWVHYRDLAASGVIGHAIPERLLRYRVRADSMLRQVGEPHQARLEDEMEAHMRMKGMQWTCTSGSACSRSPLRH
jgi:glycosyltransferase involved in cell wall biosynthesis